MMNRISAVLVSIAVVALGAAACSNSTEPTPASSLTISMPTTAPGGIVPATLNGIQYFIPRGSGRLSVPVTVTSGREVPYAALWLYLMDGSPGLGYCGQNLPDAPTWGPFSKGQTVSVTITGFQVSHVPCDVVAIRGYLHTRNSGLLTPPIESETVAQGSLNVSFSIRQGS